MLRGITLPPRGSAHSVVLEEMIHRERMRKWHYHMSDVLSLSAQMTGKKEILDKLIDQIDMLFKMEIHSSGAYDLNKSQSMHSNADKKRSDEELLKLLDKLPNV